MIGLYLAFSLGLSGLDLLYVHTAGKEQTVYPLVKATHATHSGIVGLSGHKLVPDDPVLSAVTEDPGVFRFNVMDDLLPVSLELTAKTEVKDFFIKHDDVPDTRSRNAIISHYRSLYGDDPDKIMRGMAQLVADSRYQWHPTIGRWDGDCLMGLNAIGYGYCGEDGKVLSCLANAMGFEAGPYYMSGHVAMQAYYNGDWHFFDPNHELYFEHDGSYASAEEIEAHDLYAQEFKPLSKFGWQEYRAREVIGSFDDNSLIPVELHRDHRDYQMNLHKGDVIRWDYGRTSEAEEVFSSNFENTKGPPISATGFAILQIAPRVVRRGQNFFFADIDFPYPIIDAELHLQPPAFSTVVRHAYFNGEQVPFENKLGHTIVRYKESLLGDMYTGFEVGIYAPVPADYLTGDALTVYETAALVIKFQYNPSLFFTPRKGGNSAQIFIDRGEFQVAVNWLPI